MLDNAENRSLRVLVVEDETLVGMGLKSQLQKLGHVVLGQVGTAAEAVELFGREKPDLVLMDIRLDGADGIDLCSQLLATQRCPMIIISAYSDPQLIERASAAGVFGYLIKPVSTESLQAQIEVAAKRFGDHEQALGERDKARKDLETRRLMDRAKSIVMKRLKLDEEQAHRWLQQESQKRRVPMADLCHKVIDSEELFGA